MQTDLKTERLLLRAWNDADRFAFRQLNADPRVMEFFPERLAAAASDALFERIQAHIRRYGFGPYAVESIASGSFLGFIGLFVPEFQSHFTPAIEIGWRLTSSAWGLGLATEGARAVLQNGFETLILQQVVSFTVPANIRSRRVMEKLGMSYDPTDNFDHPGLPEGHPLRPHVLYRKRR